MSWAKDTCTAQSECLRQNTSHFVRVLTCFKVSSQNMFFSFLSSVACKLKANVTADV